MNDAGWLALGVAFVVLMSGMMVGGARRGAAGDRRYRWLAFAPILLGGLTFLAVTVWVTTRYPVVGIVGTGIAIVSFVLLFRFVKASVDMPTDPQAKEVARSDGPFIDYLAWTVIAVPMIFIVALVLMLILGIRP